MMPVSCWPSTRMSGRKPVVVPSGLAVPGALVQNSYMNFQESKGFIESNEKEVNFEDM